MALSPFPEQSWAVGRGDCQQPRLLFPLGSFPRGKKGFGQEQNLISPSPGLPWGGSPTLQPSCCRFGGGGGIPSRGHHGEQEQHPEKQEEGWGTL